MTEAEESAYILGERAVWRRRVEVLRATCEQALGAERGVVREGEN